MLSPHRSASIAVGNDTTIEKRFLTYDVVRNNAIKLARKIHKGGFVPDVIYILLRGGAYLGNVISEYFKFVKQEGRPVFYAAVVARSYTDVRQHDRVMVDGWTYDPAYLRHGDRVLLVDDIFDTGRTINHLADIVMQKGIPREDLKVAVHDYKEYHDGRTVLPVTPDYWCCKHDIARPSDDIWIHYLSHELVGLSDEEKEKYYYSVDPELADILNQID